MFNLNQFRVKRAVKRERPIHFTYERESEPVLGLRVLSPYEIVKSNKGDTLVRGWDHSRGDIRSFRLDRLESKPKRADKLVQFRPPEAV